MCNCNENLYLVSVLLDISSIGQDLNLVEDSFIVECATGSRYSIKDKIEKYYSVEENNPYKRCEVYQIKSVKKVLR